MAQGNWIEFWKIESICKCDEGIPPLWHLSVIQAKSLPIYCVLWKNLELNLSVIVKPREMKVFQVANILTDE